jgi:hypothetical protein
MENIGTSCGSMDVSDDQYTSSASIKLVPDLWEQYIISEERNEGQPIIFKLASAATELVLKKAGLRTEASFLEDFKELNEEEQISVGQNMIKYSIMLKQLDMYIHGLCLVVFINCLYRRNMLDLTEEIELAVQSDMSLAGDLRKLVKTYLRCMYERDMEDYPL